MVISDNTIIALSHDKAPDKALFETSLKEFLKNDKLNVTVTLYTERIHLLKEQLIWRLTMTIAIRIRTIV